MSKSQRWTGMGYVNVPGRFLNRTRWNQLPILVEMHGDAVLVSVNLPLVRSVLRRVIRISDLAFVQDADWTTIGQYEHGVRMVGVDGSVAFVWFRAAHRVRTALANAGVEVRPPFENSSPGRWSREQFRT